MPEPTAQPARNSPRSAGREDRAGAPLGSDPELLAEFAAPNLVIAGASCAGGIGVLVYAELPSGLLAIGCLGMPLLVSAVAFPRAWAVLSGWFYAVACLLVMVFIVSGVSPAYFAEVALSFAPGLPHGGLVWTLACGLLPSHRHWRDLYGLLRGALDGGLGPRFGVCLTWLAVLLSVAGWILGACVGLGGDPERWGPVVAWHAVYQAVTIAAIVGVQIWRARRPAELLLPDMPGQPPRRV